MDFRTIKGNDHEVEVQLSLLVYKQGDYYMALCPSLDLSSYGDSVEDALVGFEGAMQIYLEHCVETGTLEADLKNHGWQIAELPTRFRQPARVTLDIPGGTLISQYNQNWYMPI